MMSRFLYLSRRAILQWNNWRSRKAMHRAYPELRELDRRERTCRKGHKKGAAAIIRAKREVVHADLAARLFPDEGNVSRAKDRARLRESW